MNFQIWKYSKASESSLHPLLHVLLTCLHKALLVVHFSVLPFEPKIDPPPRGLALLPSPVPFKLGSVGMVPKPPYAPWTEAELHVQQRTLPVLRGFHRVSNTV